MGILDSFNDARTLRLVWPQWQGAGSANFPALVPEFPYAQGRTAYAVGTRVLRAILPEHPGPEEVINTPLELGSDPVLGGVENRDEVLSQLDSALAAIAKHAPRRILTLGGDCAVSVAPFSYLSSLYGDELAVMWVDSHPDVGTPASNYKGYHAMAVSALLGKVDEEFAGRLPSLVDASRLAIAGLHEWTEDDFPHLGEWGVVSFAPDTLRGDSAPVAAWLRGIGATKVAVHFDVDVVDSEQVGLGLGFAPGGLRAEEVARLLRDLDQDFEVVGLTVAEFIPRNVLHLQNILGLAQ